MLGAVLEAFFDCSDGAAWFIMIMGSLRKGTSLNIM